MSLAFTNVTYFEFKNVLTGKRYIYIYIFQQ